MPKRDRQRQVKGRIGFGDCPWCRMMNVFIEGKIFKETTGVGFDHRYIPRVEQRETFTRRSRRQLDHLTMIYHL